MKEETKGKRMKILMFGLQDERFIFFTSAARHQTFIPFIRHSFFLFLVHRSWAPRKENVTDIWAQEPQEMKRE
tara:strand:- start:283 stop:501 length:219 start_codon:yes stop_codon:yes gene_type:complete